MAHQLQHLLGGEHLGLLVELGLVFGVVDFGVAGGHYEDGLLPHQEGQRFGDAGGLGAQSVGGQLHRGAGLRQLQNLAGEAKGLEIFFYGFYRHGEDLFHKSICAGPGIAVY